MDRKYQKIEVTKEFADMVQKYLDAENGEEHAHENASFIETLSVDFGGGIEADIKVCFERETTYIDPVLFHDGCEVCVAEVGYEILGPTEFEYDGAEYVVDVVLKEEEWYRCST